jgi:hypothetical protein
MFWSSEVSISRVSDSVVNRLLSCLILETVYFSETSVHVFETMCRGVLEDGCVIVVAGRSGPRLYTWAPLESEVLVCDG